MIIRNRRLQGNMFGAGYINPYEGDRLTISQLQPIERCNYENFLNLVDDSYKEEKIYREKKELVDQSEQKGSGILDSMNDINSMYELVKSVGSTAMDMYSGPTGNAVKNIYGKYINPHPNWRPSYVGERHLLHSSGNTFNYLGPGTHVRERLARGDGDPPLDGTYGLDAQAMKHDIAYINARSLKDVRKADKEFVRNIESSSANKVSKKIISSAMKAKMVAEDLNILDPNHYSQINIVNDDDAPMVGSGSKTSSKLRGRTMGKYPDSNLRNKLMKQYKKSKKNLINKI